MLKPSKNVFRLLFMILKLLLINLNNLKKFKNKLKKTLNFLIFYLHKSQIHLLKLDYH